MSNREKLFDLLEDVNKRPAVFKYYSSALLWNDKHVSKNMLQAHLNPETDAASYNENLRVRAIEWITSPMPA